MTIVSKDIDEITTKEEVCEALEKRSELVGLQESAVNTARKVCGGTQTAIISLPAEAAGRVRIGWGMYRFRDRVALKRCFRCLCVGHIAKACNISNERDFGR